MNWIFSRRLSFCLGLITMPVLGSGLSAQTVSSTSAPLPGTTTTSADALAPDSAKPASQTSAPANTTPTATFAQANTTTAPTPRPQDYIGLGGDIGLNGNKTSLGGGGLAILGHTRLAKLGNSAYLSLHNSTVVFGNRTATSTFTLTISTPIQSRLLGRRVVVFPFLGGGLLTRQNGGSTKFAPLLSAGVDVPIARRFTATARITAGFLAEDTEVGLQLGIGYNFSLFGRR